MVYLTVNLLLVAKSFHFQMKHWLEHLTGANRVSPFALKESRSAECDPCKVTDRIDVDWTIPTTWVSNTDAINKLANLKRLIKCLPRIPMQLHLVSILKSGSDCSMHQNVRILPQVLEGFGQPSQVLVSLRGRQPWGLQQKTIQLRFGLVLQRLQSVDPALYYYRSIKIWFESLHNSKSIFVNIYVPLGIVHERLYSLRGRG